MGLDGFVKLLEGLEIPGITGLNGAPFAGDAGHTVVESHLNNAAHIDIRHIRILLHAAGQVGLHTAAGIPIPGL